MPEVKIYTRKGDDGTTGLWYGGRVAKSDLRTSAYGDVDEAISTIGLARFAAGSDNPEMSAELLEMQRCMFIGCASLATAAEHQDRLEAGVTLITGEMVAQLERSIDSYKERVELKPKFIIPGGSELSARLDVARTVVRRAERSVVALKLEGDLGDDSVIRYLNRSSDLLFVMARFADEPDPVVFEGRG